MKPIKIKSIKKINGPAKKYDISVQKNHNYFANGILIHNCSMYRNHLHARSIDSKDHPSRHWIKSVHAQIRKDIPEGWRICGENMFALHSVYYNGLPSYFLVFAIFNDRNECLSWAETYEFCQLLGLDTVPVLYDGVFDEEKIKLCQTNKSQFNGWQPMPKLDFDCFREKITSNKENLTTFATPTQEGYVARVERSFGFDEAQQVWSKYVRRGHVQTSELWMLQPVIRNKLRTDK